MGSRQKFTMKTLLFLVYLGLVAVVNSTPLAGGWIEHDNQNDEELISLVRKVYLPTTHLEAEDLELVAIHKQVVAGMNYRFYFKIEGEDDCYITILVQEWTNTRVVTEDECTPLTGPRLP